MLKKLSIAALIFCALPAHADEFEDHALKVLELSNAVKPAVTLMERQLELTKSNTVNQLYQAFTSQGKDVTKADVEEFVEEFNNKMASEMGSQLGNLVVEAYRKHFSLEEIISIEKLMETPVFQVFAEKTPDLTASAAAAGEQLGRTLGAQIMRELIAANPKFQ